MEEYSNRADIKGINCRHLEKPLIQFEKYLSESDSRFCDTKWVQFPFGDSVTVGSRRTVTAKDPLIELSVVADMRSGPPLVWWWGGCTAVTRADIKSNKVTLLFTTMYL